LEGGFVNIKEVKSAIRKMVWDRLERERASLPPKPIYGRIPNFKGADVAAQRLRELREYIEASSIKVSPDSPQYWVRYFALLYGKTVIMPTPRLRGGFVVLDPSKIPRRLFDRAATIRGAFEYGRLIPINELKHVDLIVTGSVAVTLEGRRLGKGGGYSEYEYGILKELRAVNENTPIVTTVHDLQIVQEIPLERHDYTLDYILTPTQVIKASGEKIRPQGIIWELISEDDLAEMPILRELLRLKQKT